MELLFHLTCISLTLHQVSRVLLAQVFDGLADMVQASLKESYEAGHVSLSNGALRYLNHHSQMRSGIIIVNLRIDGKFIMFLFFLLCE